MIGGYSLVRAPNRAAAVELAKRYPHATWGPVEVREILFSTPCDALGNARPANRKTYTDYAGIRSGSA
jgi:hypothetical protein